VKFCQNLYIWNKLHGLFIQNITLGIAYQLSDDISIGVTPFISYRNQNYRFAVYSRAIPIVDSSYYVASFSNYDDILFINWKLIMKFGLNIRKENWKYGLTVTAPSINLYGDCDVQREMSVNNIRQDGPDEELFNFLARPSTLFAHSHEIALVGCGRH
jgi:hypothetical protein